METKVLIIGIGNSARGDDALGWLFVEKVAALMPWEVEYCYQLQIEDANKIQDYDTVILVDATMQKSEMGFSFTKCTPINSFSFSTHRIDPGAILWLSTELYNKTPAVHVIAIEGVQWELGQGLSPEAEHNFNNAFSYFLDWTRNNFVTELERILPSEVPHFQLQKSTDTESVR
jgi:hydrogenase maturation protease